MTHNLTHELSDDPDLPEVEPEAGKLAAAAMSGILAEVSKALPG